MQSFNRLTPNSKMFLKAIVFFALVAVANAARPQVGLRAPPILQSTLPPFMSQVVGDDEAPVGHYPFIVSLQQNSAHFCAGSILNEQWIVTAARCVLAIRSINFLRVKAGKHNLRLNEASEQTVGVVRTFIHEKYQGGPYDIGLLKLSSLLKFTTKIQSIELASPGSEPTGKAWLSGWGSTSPNMDPKTTDKLQHVRMEYINRVTCYEAVLLLTEPTVVDETNVCTGPLYDQISPCIGDSGGPLISRNGQKPILTGIVSWGIPPCATAGAPLVYTKVSKFNYWIAVRINNY